MRVGEGRDRRGWKRSPDREGVGDSRSPVAHAPGYAPQVPIGFGILFVVSVVDGDLYCRYCAKALVLPSINTLP